MTKGYRFWCAALANLSGAEGQLGFHLGGAMNSGFTEAQMQDFISVLSAKVDETAGEGARQILLRVLEVEK